MTLQNLIHLFNLRYKRESYKRKIERLEINNEEYGILISEALVDIQDKLGVLKDTHDITLDGSSEYTLEKQVGNITMVKMGDTILKVKTYEDIQSLIDSTATIPSVYATYQSDKDRKIIIWPNPSSGTLSVFFDLKLDLYIPGAVDNFAVDSSEGEITGDLLLPDKYVNAVIYYIIAQYIDELYPMYDVLIAKLKQTGETSSPESFDYHFGGLDEDREGRIVDPDLYFN